MLLPEMPRTLAVPTEILSLSLDGEVLPAKKRRELLRAVRAGDALELSLDAIVYRQPKAPSPLPASLRALANSNFVRFAEDGLVAFARSFTGKPLLRDHDRSKLLARAGRIVASELVEEDTSVSIRQQLSLVKPWAIEAALDGTLDAFSIGWDPLQAGRAGLRESMRCSVCKESLFACPCFPGEEKQLTGQASVIVEVEWANVTGVESSAVTFPAVQGTSVQDIRTALSLARSVAAQKGQSMDPQILSALGLSEGAPLSNVLAAIGGFAEDTKRANSALSELQTQLAAESEKYRSVKAQLDLERAATAQEKQAAHEAAVAELSERALATGLWEPGSTRAELFARLAASSLDDARLFAQSLEPINPTGAPMQSERLPVKDKKTAHLDDTQRAVCAQLGLSAEDFARYGAEGEADAAH